MILNSNADMAFNDLVDIDYGCNVYSFNHSSRYMYESSYKSYIDEKIENEKAIVGLLSNYIPVNESMVILEAKFSDGIKAKFNKLVEFIKGLISKFIESMSNFFMDNKDYLEKYKDIILKKKPKEELEYSYSGDYEEAINRLIKTDLPLFEPKYIETLKQEGEKPTITAILARVGYGSYPIDADEKPSEIFKEFFTAADKGQSEGKFTDLNFTNLYNFCYNYKDIEKVVKKDQQRLEQTTNTIVKAMEDELSKPTNEAYMIEGDEPQNNAPKNAGGTATGNNTNTTGNTTGDTQATAQPDNKPTQPGKTGLQISGSNAAKQMGSYDKDADAEKAANDARGQTNLIQGEDNNKKITELNKMADKWKNICSALIAAKLTAYDQIAKDYMAIIRAHVRSYGGKDLNDKTTDKTKDNATQYSKPNNNNQEEAPANNEQQG